MPATVSASGKYAHLALPASPLRNVETKLPTAVRDFAFLYLKLGLRLKVHPR